MSTQLSTVHFLLEQLNHQADIKVKPMFGEYALYCGSKLVALVCDDQLFVKPTNAGKTFIGQVVEASPYNGAKPSYLISGDLWENSEWLCELINMTAAELPEPKPKKKKIR